MTREEKLRTVKYAVYAAVMLLAFVLCSARGITPQLWGARMNPLPFLLCIIALYDGPYVGAGFGLFGLAFGLAATIWLRPIFKVWRHLPKIKLHSYRADV